jgi:titin
MMASSCTVTWQASVSDGGSPITGYIVERKPGYSTMWVRVNSKPVLDMSLNVSDMQSGTSYEFRVIAENLAGPSKPSLSSPLITAKDPYGKGRILY